MENQVLIHQPETGQWLYFQNPVQVFEIDQLSSVAPTLKIIEAKVTEGLYAAGFISYEASPAFDLALQTHVDSNFPLLWFGLYLEPQRLSSDEILSLRSPSSYTLGTWRSTVSQQEFNQAIGRIKHYIAQGDTFQVNYSFRLRTSFQGNPWSFFIELVRAQPQGYAALVDTGRYVICSASPELFFTLSASQLIAKPMKGTAARGMTVADDRRKADWLHRSEKNRAENLMIVDMIRNDLGRVATIGSVQVPYLFKVECYPTLWQMTSTVTAETEAAWSQIMSSLFPCASITGAPKPRTMEIITELETSPRRIYTGSIGYLTPEHQSQFNVAIRTVLIDRATGEAEYGVGSGIVWDSDSQQEYDECYIKTFILTKVQPDFSLLETIRWTPSLRYFLLPYHLHRLKESAKYFGFPLDLDGVQQGLNSLEASLTVKGHKIRLLVDRDGQWRFEVQPWMPTSHSEPMRVKLAPAPINVLDHFLYHKTTHRDTYEKARLACPNCDDVLLWNELGEITESCISNVIVQIEGKWVTPPVSSGLLPGTFRAWLLDSKKIEEQVITIEMLQQSLQFYLVNSVRGWQAAVLT